MSYLASTEPEQPIEIPGTGGKMVTFKTGASYADDLRVDLMASQAVPRLNGQPLSEEQSRRRSEAYVLARTATMIVAWELTDKDGSPLPIAPDSLRRLTKAVGSWLSTEAYDRFEGRSEEAERPFENGSQQPSPAASQTTPR